MILIIVVDNRAWNITIGELNNLDLNVHANFKLNLGISNYC